MIQVIHLEQFVNIYALLMHKYSPIYHGWKVFWIIIVLLGCVCLYV